ncbi:C6 zinc finger domain-containing protein [Ilyonectria destructans]|nr:C6 zinc finger domain-containing protein [Ilyonectria destructans]
MPLRLGHKKSRRGCQRCKKRRVKCDEKKPCTACINHGVTCSLTEDFGDSPLAASKSNAPLGKTNTSPKIRVSSPADPCLHFGQRLTSSATDSVFRGTWAIDLELIHHFTATTCHTLPRAGKLKQIWQVEVPKSGTKYPFVMHQILAVSALHLGHLHPENRQRFVSYASRHQFVAVAGLRKLINSITPEDCEALFSASSMLSLSAYATFSQRIDSVEAAAIPTIEDIIHVFSLVRGGNQVLICSEGALHQGSFSPIFEQQPQTGSTPFLAELVEQLGLLRVQMSSCTHNEILSREIDWFLRWIRQCSATTNEPELRIAITWSIDLSTEYISLLHQKEQSALTLLAYYCVVVSATEASGWYMENWSKNALRAIADCLGPVWTPQILWPSSIINLQLRPIG